jgi:hypothetical protein
VIADVYVRVDCTFVTRTKKAVLVEVNDREVWIPRSVLSAAADAWVENAEEGQDKDLSVREWFAEREGI